MCAKAWNIQALLESISYAAFGGCVLYLLCTGNYLTYVTPRMQPYLWITVAVMLVWIVVGISRVFRPQYRARGKHCLVLLIPVLFFLLPHSALSSADIAASASGGNIFRQSAGSNSTAVSSGGEISGAGTEVGSDSENSKASAEIQASMKKDIGMVISGIDSDQKTIDISTDEFCLWVDELYLNPALYEGYTVTITGFIYKDPEYLSENEFAAARLAMSCCTADLMPYGLVCTYDHASALQADAWVKVEGILHKRDHEGQAEPQISVTKITPTEKIPGYVYP